MAEITNEKLAFEVEDRGFKIRAFWGDGPDARIEIIREGQPYKTFTYPAYKIFNLAAHFEDIVDSELRHDDEGYKIAGSTGFGGYIITKEEEQDELQEDDLIPLTPGGLKSLKNPPAEIEEGKP
jgi:hypothetical protein